MSNYTQSSPLYNSMLALDEVADHLVMASWTYENRVKYPGDLVKMERKLDELERKCSEARKRVQEAKNGKNATDTLTKDR